MDLIQAETVLNNKDKKRQQLLGKKEALLDSLKKLGFTSISKAKNASIDLGKEILKMENHFDIGVTKFKTDFGHLLK